MRKASVIPSAHEVGLQGTTTNLGHLHYIKLSVARIVKDLTFFKNINLHDMQINEVLRAIA